MQRRSCFTAIFAMFAGRKAVFAQPAPKNPIVLYGDLSVDPAHEKQMLDNFHNTFKPAAAKFAGYIDVKILKLRTVYSGSAPADANCRFQLPYESEELRQKWIKSDVHQKLKKIYAGVQNLSNGHTIYPGNPFGTEASAVARLGTQGGGTGRGTSDLLNWTKGPAYSPVTFDFNKGVEELYKVGGADINALSADLSAFRKRGGKLITYHDWQDTTVSPFDSINYYDRIPNAKNFVRLFMVSGMDHCQNGPGLDSFGTRAVEGQLADPEHNIVSSLGRWVTKGVAPEQVIATKWSGGFGAGGRGGGRGFSGGGRGGSGGARGAAVADIPAPPPQPRVLFATRPLCAYPKVSQYKGAGDNTKAENYKCVAAPKARFTPPTPEYLVNSGAFGH